MPDGVLIDHGAVSENTVIAMLQGVFMETRADAGISISGIAGPGGGSEDKPVGTAWIAVGLHDRVAHTQKFLFDGDRSQVRLQAVEALNDRVDQTQTFVQTCIKGYRKKPFVPHITVFRKARHPLEVDDFQPIEWTIDRYVLVESVTYHEGAEYTVLKEWSLD